MAASRGSKPSSLGNASNAIFMTSLTFRDLVLNLVSNVNVVMPLLAGIAVVFFFIGLIRFIYKAGDAKGRKTGRDAIVWGLVGIFVIFSLWGIIRAAQFALLGSSTQIQNRASSFSPTP